MLSSSVAWGSRPGGSAFGNVVEDTVIAIFFGDVQAVLRGTSGRLCWRDVMGDRIIVNLFDDVQIILWGRRQCHDGHIRVVLLPEVFWVTRLSSIFFILCM